MIHLLGRLLLQTKTPSRAGGGMEAEKISSPPHTRDGVIDNRALGELRLNDRLLQKDKEKSKEAIKNNNDKIKIQQQLIDGY
jgi:hypothetical protein